MESGDFAEESGLSGLFGEELGLVVVAWVQFFQARGKTERYSK